MALSSAFSSGEGLPGSMVAGWILAAGGETIAAPGSLELCAKPTTVKNAQPTTSSSRDRLIQVFTVYLDANVDTEGSLESTMVWLPTRAPSKQITGPRIQ